MTVGCTMKEFYSKFHPEVKHVWVWEFKSSIYSTNFRHFCQNCNVTKGKEKSEFCKDGEVEEKE